MLMAQTKQGRNLPGLGRQLLEADTDSTSTACPMEDPGTRLELAVPCCAGAEGQTVAVDPPTTSRISWVMAAWRALL
jgi:hypothetical protein